MSRGYFTGGKAKIDRAADCAKLVGGKVAKGELWAVQEHIHAKVALAHRRPAQGMGQHVRFRVEFPVCPAPVGIGIIHGRMIKEPARIAHKSGQPCKTMLEIIPELLGIVAGRH